MHQIDNVRINFNQDNLLVLNIVLAFIMFGIALDIRLKDFEELRSNPRAAFIGMFAQLVLMPLVTLGLVYIFAPPPSVSLGMIAISACPGGNNSNYSTYLAKGNTALAVSTTSLSVLFCVITMPTYLYLGSLLIAPVGNFSKQVSIPFADMLKMVTFLILMPLVVGMYVAAKFPILTEKLKKVVKPVSLLLFVGLVFGAIAANRDIFVTNVKAVFWVVATLNLAALCLGYFFSKLCKLPEADARAITFETGIHNITLALIIVFQFFDGLGGMAIVAAWYGIWDLITGFSLAMWWGRRPIR